MKVFNRRNVLKGGLVGSMAAGFASFVGASHAAEPAAKAPAQNDKNTYDVIVLGAGPAGLVTAIAAKQAGAKKVVVFEKRDRPDGNAIFALGSVCGWGSRHQKEQGIKDTADDFYAMMMDVSKQMGDKALNRTYTDNISAGIDKMRVTGVKIQTPAGQEEYFSKGGVAIATGGFSANPEMVDKYIGGWATRMVLRGSKSTTGENISLTLPLYAKCVNMDQFHAGPIIGATHVNPADVLNSGYGIQVNTSGDRYMDENNTYVIKARTTAQKTLDNTGWVIVDSTCPVLDKVIPKFDMLNSPYGKANTIEEVAKQAGLPPAKIVALVKEYNDAVKNGTLGKMNPPNTYKKPHLIEKAPFYAVPLQGGMTATFGGPLINTKAEVQNLDGKTIPGLYAVGNSSGGIFFHNYAGGAQLGAATVFGRIAGKEMAQRAAAAK